MRAKKATAYALSFAFIGLFMFTTEVAGVSVLQRCEVSLDDL